MSDPEGGNWRCVSCGVPASGNFCASCGERRPEQSRHALVHIIAEGAESFFHFDAKIFSTLRALLTRPGLLTADFLAGRRRPRASPLQLFLVCNLVFFIVQPLTGLNILAPPLASQVDQTYYSGIARTAAVRHVGAAVLASPAFHRRYYQLTTVQARSLVIVMVPLFAIILSVVEAGKGRLFVEHLVFALHLYGFLLLWLSSALVLTALLIRLTPGVATARFDTPLTIVEFGGVAIYSAVALRTAYGESLLMSFTRGVLLGFGSYCILFAYRFVLFFTTLYAA